MGRPLFETSFAFTNSKFMTTRAQPSPYPVPIPRLRPPTLNVEKDGIWRSRGEISIIRLIALVTSVSLFQNIFVINQFMVIALAAKFDESVFACPTYADAFCYLQEMWSLDEEQGERDLRSRLFHRCSVTYERDCEK
ncbi:hypothetical protein PM082_003495 [Marasmius tenuissimus]|nr:hypothetical protein PM082_003495 [Marasmius tenuissimus]